MEMQISPSVLKVQSSVNPDGDSCDTEKERERRASTQFRGSIECVAVLEISSIVCTQPDRQLDGSSILTLVPVVNGWAGFGPHYRKVDTCVEYSVGMHVLAWVSGPL